MAALAIVAIAAGGIVTGPARATARTETSLRSVNQQLLVAVNEFRTLHHLAPLRRSRALDRSARQHSLEMGSDGYFGHSSADGTAFWRRIKHYYGSRNYRLWSVGENLLWAAPSVAAKEALAMWIASPEHLRNLLTARWREIGISAVHISSAPGVFQGQSVTIVTTDFGVRK
ncbi:MAG TPA: CAP domain-containing protein [Gaiellaceae bacterium]